MFQPRTVNVVAINDILVPSDRTVLALRYGYLRFRDDFASVPTDASTLGFAPAFEAAITGFPRVAGHLWGRSAAERRSSDRQHLVLTFSQRLVVQTDRTPHLQGWCGLSTHRHEGVRAG